MLEHMKILLSRNTAKDLKPGHTTVYTGSGEKYRIEVVLERREEENCVYIDGFCTKLVEETANGCAK